jgi:hypothetical protein
MARNKHTAQCASGNRPRNNVVSIADFCVREIDPVLIAVRDMQTAVTDEAYDAARDRLMGRKATSLGGVLAQVVAIQDVVAMLTEGGTLTQDGAVAVFETMSLIAAAMVPMVARQSG